MFQGLFALKAWNVVKWLILTWSFIWWGCDVGSQKGPLSDFVTFLMPPHSDGPYFRVALTYQHDQGTRPGTIVDLEYDNHLCLCLSPLWTWFACCIMTFTANGKNAWKFCPLSSAVCTVEWKYLYLWWVPRNILPFLCDLFKDQKKII